MDDELAAAIMRISTSFRELEKDYYSKSSVDQTSHLYRSCMTVFDRFVGNDGDMVADEITKIIRPPQDQYRISG